ncbi:hypothetical protein EHM76_06480, partial [bacterium]
MTEVQQITLLDAPSNDEGVVAWLNAHAQEDRFLLAFADDGVIWGKPEANKWTTSFDAFGKPFARLRGETLQEAFLFRKEDHIHLY